MITNLPEIREVSVYDVISEYPVELKAAGVNYSACCPFHGEKTASFVVSPAKNIATCFGGCGRSWDAIEFVKEFDNLTFADAAKKVAKIGGKTIEYKDYSKASAWESEQKEQKEKENSLLPTLKLVFEKFHENAGKLPISEIEIKEEKVQFIEFMNRQFRLDNLKKFGYGVASGDLVKKSYKKEAWDPEILKELGLLMDKGKGTFDFFRDRHIVAIQNHLGQVRGLAGRVLDNSEPKYLNSPESAIFKKSTLLFGLYQNCKAIQKAGECILVEGYTDVITMSEYGFDNVVATCGTALTVEQCQLLKRFTDTIIILRDNDKAGEKATIRDVELLIKSGFMVKVIKQELENKKVDPDSFLREKGPDVFSDLLEQWEYGLIWRVMLDVNEKDEFTKTAAMELAARLISFVKKENDRIIYIGQLTSNNRLGPQKKILQEEIKKEEDKRLKSNGSGLTAIQERDLKTYGIYIHNNKYYKRGKGGDYSMPLSNFVIDPIYLVASMENPTRMVIIKNVYGHAEIIDANTDTFVELGTFKKEIARHGNFRFEGDTRSSDYNQIIAKMYDETEKVFRITTLGWHNKGFFTWINGITVDGKFQHTSENGVVEHEGIRYILPGKQFFNKNDDAFDDTSADEEYLKLYKYKECDVKFKDYILMMYGVHEENALAGLAFYFAALFRDVIYSKLKSFPILDLFGPKGRGKSTLAWSLSFLYGDARAPLNLSNFTKHGFVTRGNQIRNGLLWCDEFSNKLEDDTHELLKGVYDGAGRERGKKDNKKSTENIKIISALMMSGQDLPLKHIALYDRCITLHFNYKKSQEGYVKYQALNNLELTGKFSHYTSMLQALRPEIEKEFDITFDKVRSELETSLPNAEIAEARIIQNHSVILAMTAIFEKHLGLPDINGKSFYSQLLDYVVRLVDNQSNTLRNQDELADWWATFIFLIEQRSLKHNKDFIIEEDTNVRIKLKNTRKDTAVKQFDSVKKILYMRFERTHPLYMEQMRRQGKNPFELATLKHYMESHDSFIGEVRSKRIGKFNGQCWAFDLSKLSFDLPLTIEAESDPDDLPPSECPKCNKPFTKCQCNIDPLTGDKNESEDDLPF